MFTECNYKEVKNCFCSFSVNDKQREIYEGSIEQLAVVWAQSTCKHFICCRYFTRFQYCRYALHVRRCEPNGDGISSFNNLLDLLLLRACVWIVAIITCIGNASVVLFRILFKDEHRVHSLFIKNLCSKSSSLFN